ncbi:hypothetical protein WJX79_006534 [Trebouxia sp. C0005]
MEEEEMTFDAMPAVHLELVRKKLSRLKRAHVPSEAVTAAQPHSPAVAAFDAAPRALSDRTNLESYSAKRDVIGQGHAIQWQPLSSVLGKILTRKDAVIMRAPVVPVRPAKPVRQAPASPPGLQSRLHSQAGKLIGHPEEAQDQDLLVLSDDDSEQGGPQRDAVLADATLSLDDEMIGGVSAQAGDGSLWDVWSHLRPE